MRGRAFLVLYLMIVAFLLGMAAEKVRFGARRDEVLGRYEQALARWRAAQLRAERAAGMGDRYGNRGARAPSPLGAPLDGSVLPPQDR